MIIKQKILELKASDNFSVIDKIATKILMISICAFVIFNSFNFMFKENYFKTSILKSYAKEIGDKIKPNILKDGNIKFYLYKEKPIINQKEVYNEIIYFTGKKDIGNLVNKAKDLIQNASANVKDKYIEVKIKEYNTKEEIATVIWSRENKNEYLVYTK